MPGHHGDHRHHSAILVEVRERACTQNIICGAACARENRLIVVRMSDVLSLPSYHNTVNLAITTCI